MPPLTTDLATLIIVAALAYGLGSVPFGVVITRILGLGDLRSIGSGNIGATNVLRTGNKGAAAATLILDAAKAGVAVLIARWLVAEDAAQLAGLSAFMGHIFPIWLGFKGGKGVATFLGTLLALSWPVGLACCGVWLLMAAAFRISSLAALTAAGTSTIFMVFLGEGRMLFLGIFLTIVVYLRHLSNIQRMKNGTEPRIGRKSQG
jgi:acyl phosphate:glycerol-3-phosphate acyltransferase